MISNEGLQGANTGEFGTLEIVHQYSDTTYISNDSDRDYISRIFVLKEKRFLSSILVG